MNWISLLGAFGIGAIVVKLVDVTWLQSVTQRAAKASWLRDQRLRVYSNLTKELISHGRWSGTTSYNDALAIAAEAMLVSDEPLACKVDGYFVDLNETLERLRQFDRQLAVDDANKARERAALQKTEFERLQKLARELVRDLRTRLLHD